MLQVLQDLFLALGTSEQQLLPLEVESLNCGGNARCSMELVQRLGLKPQKVIMIQVRGVLPHDAHLSQIVALNHARNDTR